MWNEIIKEFTTNPRDIHTIPMTKKEPIWFYIFVENGRLYVEGGKEHMPKSTAKRREIKESELECMLEIYHRKLKGENVSNDATKNSRESSYWYGIFAEMNY